MEALTLMGLTLQSMLCSHEFSPSLVVAIRLNTVSLERGGNLLKQIDCHL